MFETVNSPINRHLPEMFWPTSGSALQVPRPSAPDCSVDTRFGRPRGVVRGFEPTRITALTTPDITAPSRQIVAERVTAGRSGPALAVAGSLAGMLALQACAPPPGLARGPAGLAGPCIDQD